MHSTKMYHMLAAYWLCHLHATSKLPSTLYSRPFSVILWSL